MDKTTAGLLGAVAGLATMGVAQAATPPMAAPSEALQAASYADLLAPVQNAVAVLRADDAARANDAVPEGGIQPAQYYSYGPAYHHHHHHHHHHHQAYNRHHHHHHQSSYVGIPGVGGVIIGRR
jgi:hypothetical protein